jgi:hypothetical protein
MEKAQKVVKQIESTRQNIYKGNVLNQKKWRDIRFYPRKYYVRHFNQCRWQYADKICTVKTADLQVIDLNIIGTVLPSQCFEVLPSKKVA